MSNDEARERTVSVGRYDIAVTEAEHGEYLRLAREIAHAQQVVADARREYGNYLRTLLRARGIELVDGRLGDLVEESAS